MAASLGLRHVNLNVTDLAREVLTEFPETITVDGREVELRHAMLTTPGTGDLLALSRRTPFRSARGSVNHLGMIYASNADVEAAIARAVQAGGEVTRQGEREDCGVREVFAYARDADGYVVELSTQEPLLRLAGMAPRVDVREAVPASPLARPSYSIDRRRAAPYALPHRGASER
jgi:catechol 2,3-dioxygenase-like lactoylglutathione lyase family enzyme